MKIKHLGLCKGAYPRERGATLMPPRRVASSPGLSPRARGNRVMSHANRLLAGPIPASAGQPCCSATRWPWSRAYPRERGATTVTSRDVQSDNGLSPRARGNRGRACRLGGGRGPIPASAGQPRRAVRLRSDWRAYPRERGATRGQQRGVRRLSGLSPRARGNHHRSRQAEELPGPIPASAGQPLMRARSAAWVRAYPRERGATSNSKTVDPRITGLSPRARGNRAQRGRQGAAAGPIPASAGQPCPTAGPRCRRGAYPRERGATRFRRTDCSSYWGLSPRARGNHQYQ